MDIAIATESKRVPTPKSAHAKKYLEEILWSDPGDSEESYPSPRGAGRIFGEKLTRDMLTKLGVKTLIRSHEPCDGISMKQKGKILLQVEGNGEAWYINPDDLKKERVKYKPGLIPPYYADLPNSIEEVWESERKYLAKYKQHALLTQIRYFWKALVNIIFKNARSG